MQATNATFDSNKTAIWWAFLRLTDPGYLGDDEGLARRIISTVLTVLGYVLFMGSLIAILTQWLNQKIRNFESGLTPIVRRNHILILGWTNRTPAIVAELMRSEGTRTSVFTTAPCPWVACGHPIRGCEFRAHNGVAKGTRNSVECSEDYVSIGDTAEG